MSGADKTAGRRGLITIVAALVLLVAAAAAGYAVWAGGDKAGGTRDTGDEAHSVAGVEGRQPGVPTIMSLDEIHDLGAEKGPLYWAGPRDGVHYEVTVTSEGGTYIRYLPDDVEAGTKEHYLTVGTYASINGYDALAAAKQRDADVEVANSGAVIATFKSAALSTYFAFPKASFQVEVFSLCGLGSKARQRLSSSPLTLAGAYSQPMRSLNVSKFGVPSAFLCAKSE